jgi:hypothetical protein
MLAPENMHVSTKRPMLRLASHFVRINRLVVWISQTPGFAPLARQIAGLEMNET